MSCHRKTNLLIFTWYFLIFNRQQKEREIRHRIKKGDLADIPKEVLETMAPSLLMPSKGMFGNLFSVLWFCLNGFRTKVPISNYIWPMNWIELNWIFKCKTIAEICFLRTAILHCTWTWIITIGNTWVPWISNILSICRVGSYEYLVSEILCSTSCIVQCTCMTTLNIQYSWYSTKFTAGDPVLGLLSSHEEVLRMLSYYYW